MQNFPACKELRAATQAAFRKLQAACEGGGRGDRVREGKSHFSAPRGDAL